MKRFILSSTLGLLLLAAGVPVVEAAELTEIQVTKVLTLLKTYTDDNALIGRVEQALRSATPPAFCYTFDTNLKIGDTGPAVSALQQALLREGQAVAATGVFDTQTAFAVKSYQEARASEVLVPAGLERGTGYVGASTRAVLNARYACGAAAPVHAGADRATAARTTSATSSLAVARASESRAPGLREYTGDARIDQTDTQYLLEVSVGLRTCPEGRVCDLNQDGRVTSADALVLANHVGSPAKTGQLDYTNDYRIDADDVALLGRVVTGATVCSQEKVCDISGDGYVTETDLTLLKSYVGS